MNLELRDRVAIVTGAGRGIGAAIARTLAGEGAIVVLADREMAGAQDAARCIREAGGKAIAIGVDVTDARAVEELLTQTRTQFGGPDILVNNAGFTKDNRISVMSEEDWDLVVDVVVKGAFLCTKAALPSMIEKRWGRIINISSRAHLGNPGQANYSTAKAGLIGFTRAMAMEQGKFNITVNAVAPGLVDTEAVRSLPHFDKIKVRLEQSVPVPRMGRVEDVADAVTFLASARASYISGDVIHVTGGRY